MTLWLVSTLKKYKRTKDGPGKDSKTAKMTQLLFNLKKINSGYYGK